MNYLIEFRKRSNDKKLFIPTESLRHERHYLLQGDFLLLNGFFTKEEYEAFRSKKEEVHEPEDEENIYLQSLGLPSDEIFRAELDYPDENIIDSQDLFLRKASNIPPKNNETNKSPIGFYKDIDGYVLRLRTEDYFSEGILRDRIANSDYWSIVRNNAA